MKIRFEPDKKEEPIIKFKTPRTNNTLIAVITLIFLIIWIAHILGNA